MRVALNRPREQAECLNYPRLLVGGPKWYSAQIEIIGSRVARRSVSSAPDLGGVQRRFNHAGCADRHLILKREYVFQRTVEAVGPEMRPVCRVDQLGRNAHTTARLAYRAFQDITDAEL